MGDREYFNRFEIVMLLIMIVQGFLCSMLVNYKLYADLALTIIICLYTVYIIKYNVAGYRIKRWLSCIMVVMIVVCEIFNLISVRYWTLAVFVVACNICAIAEVIYIRNSRTRYIWRKKFVDKAKRVISNFFIAVIMGTIAIVSICISVSELMPDVVIDIFDTEHSDVLNEEIVLGDGTRIIKDIKYSDNYDNSYMDVYISPKSNKNSPTFFYVHGGAYAIGDKTGKGFMISTYDVSENYFKYYVDKGYNLVSVNYAMSPKNKYPTQLNQIVEAVDYTIKNCDYVNMNDVVFGGDSAGGNLIGQFINIQTNEEYAQLLGIEPTINKKNIRAVVFISALLDNERMDETGNIFIDYAFNLLGRSYFGVWTLDGNEEINKTNVITYATENFPPTYISDGNCRSFSEQAIELSNKLNDLGVENMINYYTKDVAKLGHVYEYKNSEYSAENVSNTLIFLDSVKKK